MSKSFLIITKTSWFLQSNKQVSKNVTKMQRVKPLLNHLEVLAFLPNLTIVKCHSNAHTKQHTTHILYSTSLSLFPNDIPREFSKYHNKLLKPSPRQVYSYNNKHTRHIPNSSHMNLVRGTQTPNSNHNAIYMRPKGVFSSSLYWNMKGTLG
jgi:hypothetical protein